MILWMLVVVFMALAIASGFLQGGVRALFSFIGLMLGALLAIPLTGLGGAILGLFKIEHPMLIQIIGPLIPFVLVSLVVFGLGFLVHYKVNMFFKYRTDDTTFFKWEKLNKQLGLCFGTLNGAVVAIVITIILYVPGYFTVQFEKEGADPWYLAFLNKAAKDVDGTGFYRTISPWVPASTTYFEACDTLGWLYHNPTARDRVSRYPLLMPLAEEQRYQELARDTNFVTAIKRSPGLLELADMSRVSGFINDHGWIDQMVALLGDHLPDLNSYLRSGQTADFADEQIVDRWYFNLGASWNHVAQRKLPLTLLQKRALLNEYRRKWRNSTVTAFLDKTILFKGNARGETLDSTNMEDAMKRINEIFAQAFRDLGSMIEMTTQFSELVGVPLTELATRDSVVIPRARYDQNKAAFDRLKLWFDQTGTQVTITDQTVTFTQSQGTEFNSGLDNIDTGSTGPGTVMYRGTWEHLYANKYGIRLKSADGGNQELAFDALLETNRLIFTAKGISLVYDR